MFALPNHSAGIVGSILIPNIFIIPIGVKKSIIHLKERNSIILPGSAIGFVKLLKKSIIHSIIPAIIFTGRVTIPNIILRRGWVLDAISNIFFFISANFDLSASSSGFLDNASSNLSFALLKSSGSRELLRLSTSFNKSSSC